ncbi:MAG: acyltransferase family protein [Micropruina sp.]
MTSTVETRPATTTAERLHGLDALRAGALLLGIVLHSLLPFIPGIPWLVIDTRSSELTGIPVFVIHLFRMTLFMLLAGYFGRLVLQRRGPGRYLRDRVVRILLPFLAFWPIAVLPLGLMAMFQAEQRGEPLLLPPPTEDPLLTINPGQLWFLLVLMQCVVLTLLARALIVPALGRERAAAVAAWCGRVFSSPAGVLVAAVPYFVALLMQGTVLGGILAPETLVPSASALTAYLGAFLVGWTLQARPDALRRIARGGPVQLGAAALFTVVGFFLSTPDSAVPLPVTAGVIALASWCWVYALLALATTFLTRERPVVRYLADASYWMYLLHLPLLVGFELLLAPLDWPILAKLGLTWVVVGLALLVSYHLLVRSTPIGRWLNGRRYPFRLGWGGPDERRDPGSGPG